MTPNKPMLESNTLSDKVPQVLRRQRGWRGQSLAARVLACLGHIKKPWLGAQSHFKADVEGHNCNLSIQEEMEV